MKRPISNLTATEIVVAPCLIDGQTVQTDACHEVLSPYDGGVVTRSFLATPALAAQAVQAARLASHAMARMPAHERAQRLQEVAESVSQDTDNLATLLSRETGKTLRESRTELGRSVGVLKLCAQEAVQIAGRQIPLDASALGVNKLAVSKRFPIGVVAMVVPFNAPVNLTCHKLGPALAAGNACVLKTPPQAPGTISRFMQHVLNAGFPSGAVNMLHGGADVGQAMVANPQVDFISFTGSLLGGRAVKAAAGLRPCILELGGLGPTVVHADADLALAATSCVAAGYRLAGQSCASVQNVFVHESVAIQFEKAMLMRIHDLKLGDPLDLQSDLGPVINTAAAERIVARIQEALGDGAKLLAGGTRDNNMVQPTLLSHVKLSSRAVCEEIFGPVVMLHSYSDLEDVIHWVNESGFGINFGLFTQSIAIAMQAHQNVIAGAVIVNGSSTFRPDQMPYGGDRHSGYGRECPSDTVRAMTRECLIVFQ